MSNQPVRFVSEPYRVGSSDSFTFEQWMQKRRWNDAIPHERHLLVYHAKCMDGAVAAQLLRESLLYAGYRNGQRVKLLPMSYGELIQDSNEDLSNTRLFIVDFSFDLKELNRLADVCRSVMVIDHHYTFTKQFINAAEQKFDFFVSVDASNETDSGGSLVHAWVKDSSPYKDHVFHSKEELTQINRVVESARVHDLWLHEGNPEHEAMALNYWFSHNTGHPGMSEFDDLHFVWRVLTNEGAHQAALQNGQQHLKVAVDILIAHFNRHGYLTMVYNHLVAFCPCEKKYGSLMGTILNSPQYFDRFDKEKFGRFPLQVAPFSATYFQRPNGEYEISLRTSKARNHNVGALAQDLGGGGHRRAAGYVVKDLPKAWSVAQLDD